MNSPRQRMMECGVVALITRRGDGRHSYGEWPGVFVVRREVGHESSSSENANRTKRYSVCH
jgi:hypothetical protein